MKQLLFLLMIMSGVLAHSQGGIGNDTDHEILQKYWYYRWRLRNDFVYIGENQGESLPISERHVGSKSSKKIGMGDATQLLAFYITTLATEHKLLSDGNRTKDLPMTRTELYYAYKAFERLDLYAEEEFPFVYDTIPVDVTYPRNPIEVQVKKIRRNQGDYPASLNGYFNREDFPKEYFGDDFSDPCSWGNIETPSNEHYQHLNSSITRQSPQHTVFSVEECMDLKYHHYEVSPLGDPCPHQWPVHWSGDVRAGDDNYPNIPGAYVDMDKQYENSPSTDQIGSLMQAFLMTKVSMPNYSVPVTKLDGSVIQVNFVQLAKDNSARILNHLKLSNIHPWKVMMPNGNKVDGDKGGNGTQYSFVLAQIGNMIHDNNLALPYYGIPSGFHDFTSLTRRVQWQAFRMLPPSPNTGWGWNAHSDIMNYAATSASWTENNSPYPFYHTTRKDHTLEEVALTSARYGWDPFHMMVMGYLHDVDMNAYTITLYTNNHSSADFDISTSFLETYISYVKKTLITAPCEGPYTFPEFSPGDSQVSGDIGPKGWNMSKRWFGPKYLATNNYQYKTKDGVNVLRGRTPLPTSGYYSGLDFMMLHNLYYLNNNQVLPKYVNYIVGHKAKKTEYENDTKNIARS